MKSFGHIRYDRDENGVIVGQKYSPARAKTVGGLPDNFGADKKRRLVVSLDSGDLITIRPEKTMRPVQIEAKDLYFYLLKCQANLATLEKARERKAAKILQRQRRRDAAAEKRLTRK